MRLRHAGLYSGGHSHGHNRGRDPSVPIWRHRQSVRWQPIFRGVAEEARSPGTWVLFEYSIALYLSARFIFRLLVSLAENAAEGRLQVHEAGCVAYALDRIWRVGCVAFRCTAERVDPMSNIHLSVSLGVVFKFVVSLVRSSLFTLLFVFPHAPRLLSMNRLLMANK